MTIAYRLLDLIRNITSKRTVVGGYLCFCVWALFIPLGSGWLAPSTHFNFGPSDQRYLEGFEPMWEIDTQGVATHWSSYASSLRLPFTMVGSDAELRYRFQRVYGETAKIVVRVNGVEVDRFEARGGKFEQRSVSVRESVLARSRLRIDFEADSHEGRNRGLRWDWLDITAADTAVAVPRLWEPVASMVVMIALLLSLHQLGAAASTRFLSAAVLATLMSTYGAAAGLLALSHWLESALPGFVLLAFAAFAFRRGARNNSTQNASLLWSLLFIAFAIRSMGVLHPLFYHPDLRAHADMARIVSEAGIHFWLEPSRYISEQGVWTAAAVGKNYAFPFSPVFHVPFAVLSTLATDGFQIARTMEWMKLAGCLISSLELVVVYRLARRWTSPGISLWAAAVVVVSPASLSRLSYVFLAAIFAHGLDVLCLERLSLMEDQRSIRRVYWVTTILLLAFTFASYPGSLIHFGFIVPILALSILWFGEREHRKVRFLTLLAGSAVAAGAVMCSVYQEFSLVFLTDIVPRLLDGGEQGGSLSPLHIVRLAVQRVGAFYSPLEAIFIVAGAFVFLRGSGVTRAGRLLAVAWLASFMLELTLRSAMPDLFGKVKEILWVAPLLAILTALTLGQLHKRFGMAVAGLAFSILCIVNLRFFAIEIGARFLLAR